MKKLSVNLEHCYGIKKLIKDFDFSEFKTFLIYAPNGVMKTSFAKTLKVISAGKETPCDQMDDTVSPVYNFHVDDSTNQIDPKEICVIDPYNEKAFESGDKILTLLADEESRKTYLEIFRELDDLKRSTLSILKKLTGSSNYEVEILDSFSGLEKKNIFEIIQSILPDIKASKESFDFKYNDVFDPTGKVKTFLGENLTLLQKYIEKYEELVSNSQFFGKDTDNTFGTTEANMLNGSLEGDSYFKTGHKLLLKSHGEVGGREVFSKILKEEVDKIFNDSDLKEIFKKIDSKLDANKELKSFKKVIENNKNKYILSRLTDYNKFRQEVWTSFLRQIEPGLESLVELYELKKPELEKIIKNAEASQPQWESAIQEFDNRFLNIPFTIEIKNKADAILNAQAPAVNFKFKGKDVERKKLIENVLSQGERRAFYLLNVIFEIKSRQIQKQKTLFVIDDIADSFDYKNKYAIVEYLNDLSKDGIFYSIILTHNFDLFRTLQSRILPGKYQRSHSFVAENLGDEIRLVEAGSRNVTDPFSSWRLGINTNKKHLIACIPFVRCLIDFKEGKSDGYLLLTHILHYKDEDKFKNVKATADIKIADLQPIFKEVLSGISFEFENMDTTAVVDIVFRLIKEIKTQVNSDSIVLEDKIILAIGIRLKAELYMLSKISNKKSISGSQTGVLFQEYKDEFGKDLTHAEVIKILESVNIMTPENIHLNSFMYEPIIDMGIEELKSLYEKISSVK
ncbi:MAG: putative cytosolic protein [Candidatus Nomurabacteria bacterium]|nr:putative cytosolic protein [Candidatus Nomurabacteria bacterium]